jgi:hypothetical protein
LLRILALVGASTWLLTAACTPAAGAYSAATGPAGARARDLLLGIADDVRSIFEAFSDGIDAPKSPVNDPIALKRAKSDLDSATTKAEELANELADLQQASATNGR